MGERLSETDRRSLATLVATGRDWRLSPACFRPNALCLEQAERGLIDIATKDGRYLLRLTELGRELMSCRGEA